MPHTTPDGRPRSIGAVLGALRKEFPEVTVSRIRFLETEGLVRPERTPSGHRRFRDADVQRLRRALALQRDHCLPLRAVREQLDAEELHARGRGAEVSPLRTGPGAAPGPATPVRVGRDRFLAAAGADAEACAAWEAYGLVRGDESDGYDVGQVAVALMLTELGRHGLEPRHLRAVKAAADRAAGLVEQVVAPLRANRDPSTREQAEATARELAHLTARLHDAYLRAALQPHERPAERPVRDPDARAERVPDYPNGPGRS